LSVTEGGAVAPTTTHEARAALPQLIRAAESGTPTVLSRKSEHAVLVAPAQAAGLGWDLARADVYGIVDARKKLGDLIHLAFEGRPQVMRRHTTPVAVLLPASSGGTARPAAAAPPSTASDAPAAAPSAMAPTIPATPSAGSAADPVVSEPAADSAADTAPLAADVATGPPAAALAGADAAVDGAPVLLTDQGAPGAGDAAPEVVEDAGGGRRLAPLGQVLDTVLAPHTSASKEAAADASPARRGLSTGIATLDHALGGLQSGRFYLVAAAPGTGGSLIATTAARTAALDEHRTVLYAASGLTRADVAARIVAAHLPVDYRRLRTGQLTATEQARVTALYRQLPAAHLFIDDGSDLTPTAIADSAEGLVDLALVVVDRLQSADDPRLPLSGPRLTDAVQALAHLARTLHLPVLAVLDTDHPDQVAALGLDVTLRLTPDPEFGGRLRLAVAERDLGPQASLTLRADLVHARLTDPVAADPTDIASAPRAAGGFLAPPAPPDAAGGPPPAHTAMPDLDPAVPGSAHRPTAADPGPDLAPTSSATEPVPDPGLGAAADELPPAPAPTDRDGAAVNATAPAPGGPPGTSAVPSAPAPGSAVASVGSAGARGRTRPSRAPSSSGGGGYAGRDYSYFTGQISRTVDQALQDHGGDVEAATQALVKKAVPNAMALFEETRVGSNYEHTVYPEILELLKKKTREGADDVWEGRHNWTNIPLIDALNSGAQPPVTVDPLDTNAAFLSAFKTYLPIGALQHDPTGGFDPKRSGIYRLDQRPTWHHPDLPDPIGNRRETGPVLLTDPTIRLLQRCARYDLCEPPVITESWTSGASEGLLEKFRRILTEARKTAVERKTAGYTDGEVTVEYIKAMYSKFTSTLGESNANLDIRRPDWMHIIRSQAFANLWYKAHKAHQAGFTIVRVRGTDELHVTGGDWRTVFDDGRLTNQMKLKDNKRYTLPRKTTA
jgi:hypothetical protein